VADSVLRCVKLTSRDHHNMDEPTAPTDPLRWSRGRTRRAAAELVNEAESLCRGAHPARVRRERDQLGEAIGCSEVTAAAQRLGRAALVAGAGARAPADTQRRRAL
jgi:hypothetical protein